MYKSLKMGIVPTIDELEVNALACFICLLVQCHNHCIRIGQDDDLSRAFKEIRILYPNAAATTQGCYEGHESLVYKRAKITSCQGYITREMSLVRCMIMQYHGARWLQPNPNMWCMNQINATQADGTCFVPTLQLWRQSYTQVEIQYVLIKSRVFTCEQ